MKYVKSLEFLENGTCRVILDDYTVLELDAFSVSASTVQPESEVEDAVLDELIEKTDCIRAQKLATKLINSKMRTEKQLVKLLKEKGVSQNIAEKTAETMKEYGYTDDRAYARAYIEYRLEGSKKSFRAIRFDLKIDGISDEITEEVLSEFDADENKRAMTVAEKVLHGKTDEASVKKLQGVLQRNGFDWDSIKHVLDKYVISDGENY